MVKRESLRDYVVPRVSAEKSGNDLNIAELFG